MAQTTEKAFETYVMQMLAAKGWQLGSASAWDKELALFPDQVTAFIADTQPELWADMRTLHADQLETMLVRELAIKGSLNVFRHGFKFYGKIFRMAFFKPAHGLNPEMLARYGCNGTECYPPGPLPSR